MKLIATFDNDDHSSPIEYVLDLILSTYGLDYSIVPFKRLQIEQLHKDRVLVISYGSDVPQISSCPTVHIYASGFFGQDYLDPRSMPLLPLDRHLDLPVIYRGNGGLDGFVKKSDGLMEIDIDIVASSFFMLSRYEEVVVKGRDRHDRFPVEASVAHVEGFLDRPIVNEYIELLWEQISALAPELKRQSPWPKGREFAICLTHDIDFLRKYSLLPPLTKMGSALLRQHRPHLARDIALDYSKTALRLQKDPLDTVDFLLESRPLGLSSSFFFVVDNQAKLDGGYSSHSKVAHKLIRQIEDAGCEVGLHGSYDSYCDADRMISEKRTLDGLVRNTPYGCRQHFLRWSTPYTWRAQQRAGLLYDTTLTFAEHAGFRCGICLPFKPFDVIEGRRLDIWELPLTVMDQTLQKPDYENLAPEQAYTRMTQLIETVRRFSGVFVLVWHNSSFDAVGGWKGWKSTYQKTMDYVSRQNVFIASGREIVNTWAEGGH